MSGFLHKQVDEDSTYAGSVILEDLRAELFADSDSLILSGSMFDQRSKSSRSTVETEWDSILDLNQVPNNLDLASTRDTR